MPIAFESGGANRIEGSGYIHGMSCRSVYDPPETGRSAAGIFAGERRFSVGNMVSAAPTTTVVVQEEDLAAESSSSSSIGRNSDVSGKSSDADDSTEVQSSYKGPLESLDSLEDVLPIKRGMSKFYCGKSKSYTNLSDASSSSSIKDIAKPENAYTRRRKNLLAHSNFWDKNRNYPLRSNGGGISKRQVNASRSNLALALNLSNSSDSNINGEKSNSSSSSSSSHSLSLPPLHPQGKRLPHNGASSPRKDFSPWRSFSLSDLQSAAVTTGVTVSVMDGRAMEGKPD